MLSAPDLEHRRILLVGLAYPAWYLGESIYGWEGGLNRRRVPFSPPITMLWTTDLARKELATCLVGYDELEDLNIQSRRKDFAFFIPQLLVSVLFDDDVIAQVLLLTYSIESLLSLIMLTYPTTLAKVYSACTRCS